MTRVEVIGCDDLDAGVAALVEAGMRLDVIMPAEAPAVAELSGPDGRRVRLERRADAPPPDTGRAGMVYRDLLPDREGGRFIASHITIPDGGPVPDYVHHHDVRIQIIHCVRGWVRVVYEDQGPPFTMRAGDTVLQPPHIRHRVLEASPGLEVVEVTGPAAHPTFVEHVVELPTTAVRPDRDFDGQRFVRHERATATWGSWRGAGFTAADTGIGAATDGRADARTVRVTTPGAELAWIGHDDELVLWFVEAGHAVVSVGDDVHPLAPGEALAVPPGRRFAVTATTTDLRLFEVVVS